MSNPAGLDVSLAGGLAGALYWFHTVVSIISSNFYLENMGGGGK